MRSSRPSETGERLALVALSLRHGTGGAAIKNIMIAHSLSWSESLARLVARSERIVLLAAAAKLISSVEDAGARMLLLEDPEYPRSLLELSNPPPFICVKGDPAVLEKPCVAIVGARSATRYGERVTREISGALATSGICIVSGMARGIDAAAHRSAIDAGGTTCAVLGTGIDVPYPAGHRALHAGVAECGVVVSELEPGSKAAAGAFPRRNRIIAALARLTVVVEAGAKSGALITVGHALDLGRDVGAVPGPIDTPQSVGSNQLLRDGAHVITSVDDVFALLGLTVSRRRRPDIILTPAEEKLVNILSGGPVNADALIDLSGMPVAECLSLISSLELAGVMETTIAGEIRRIS